MERSADAVATRRYGRRAVGFAGLALCAALALTMLVPALFGLKRYVVTGGSMGGTIERGILAGGIGTTLFYVTLGRNGSVSDRLWRLLLSPDPDQEIPTDTVVEARWLGEMPLHVWRVADGQPVLKEELRGCRSHGFSPDGRQLAVGWQEWVLCFDLATGQEVKRWRLPARGCSLAFHPDNRKLAVGYACAKPVSVYDLASADLITSLPVGKMRE